MTCCGSVFVVCAVLASLSHVGSQVPQFIGKPAWPYMPTWPLLVDLDNDGQVEVVECNMLTLGQPGTTLTYRRLLGNGEFSAGPLFSSAAFAQFTIHVARAAGDVNGDGNNDIYVCRMVAGQGAPTPGTNPWYDQLWLGDGQGGLTEASQNMPSVRTNVSDAEFADFDQDGDLDLVLCDISGLLLWINDGTGRFRDESLRRVENHAMYSPWRSAVLDADQDGDLDILVANGFGALQPTVLYINEGRAMFKAHSQGIVRIAELYVLDADHDGWDDVVAGYPNFATVFVARPGQVPMAVAPQLLPPTPTGIQLANSLVVDADRDGDEDIIANFGALGCQYWENTPNGFAVVPGAIPAIIGLSYAIDYDWDGDIDFLGGSPGVATQLYFSSTQREVVKLNEPVRGGTFQADVYAMANHVMFVGLSTNYLRQPLWPLGLLYLDPTQSTVFSTLTYLARGRQSIAVPIPNLPGLVGQLLCIQGIDLDYGAGAIRMSNAITGLVQ